jgi:hypothetical protein
MRAGAGQFLGRPITVEHAQRTHLIAAGGAHVLGAIPYHQRMWRSDALFGQRMAQQVALVVQLAAQGEEQGVDRLHAIRQGSSAQ